jgi:hypothetical protein
MYRPVRLFNLDLHISVIQDVKHVLNHLYGPTVEVTNWSISGHNWVFGAPTPSVEIINAETWRSMTPETVLAFQTKYDAFLSSFDGFIVTHTPVFCMLYEKYGKPILLVNSCRYEQPFCWTGDLPRWEWLHAGLVRMATRRQLVAVSNNKADRDYLLAGAGVASVHIPSLCLYTRAEYAPTKRSFVCFGDRGFFPACDLLVEKPAGGYSWGELYSHKGIVHIPYEMSTMSLFEQYSAGVPLWLPSRIFYAECVQRGTMPMGSVYGPVCPPGLASVRHSLDFWLDRADYYDVENFRGVRFYNSADDLIRQIIAFHETEDERAERRAWITSRRNTILSVWSTVLADFVRPN